jgi:hypothetical protein
LHGRAGQQFGHKALFAQNFVEQENSAAAGGVWGV